MKTIILCGGQGTRLKEETEFKPKAMVYVGGKPILWHIMKIYAHYGFNEFILALGYKADYIKQFFLNQKAFISDFTLNTYDFKTDYHWQNRQEVDDFKITFVDTGLETLPGERILKCKKYIPKKDDSFMLTYGDGVSDLNINKLVKFYYSQKTLGLITGAHPRSKFGMISINKDNKVKSFMEKPVLKDWINAGFMVLNRKVFDYIKKGEWEHEMLKRLAAAKQLSVYKHEGFWASMDTYKEVNELNELWQKQAPWKVWK